MAFPLDFFHRKMKFVRKYFFIAIFLFANYVSGLTQGSSQKPIVLRGTIILPNKVIKHGYVAIVNGRIASVSEELPDIPGTITVNTWHNSARLCRRPQPCSV